MPKVLMPRSAGVDISDSSIKWLLLSPFEKGFSVQTYGELPLQPGIVINGIIHDVPALAEALRLVKKELKGVSCAHAALPEEAAYVFSMSVPRSTPRAQVLSMIEFEFEGRVPIPPSAAVFDYSVISDDESSESEEISVVVFPKDIAQAYFEAFFAAGVALLSLEVEARSIARSVSSEDVSEPITLLVDFGRARTGFAVVKRGVPIFTSTVDVGGNLIEKILTEKLAMTHEDAEKFKNDEGLLVAQKENSQKLEAVTGAAAALAEEVGRHYHYWETRRNEHGERMMPVGRVILVGGNSNLRGLADYIAGRVHVKTQKGNVWRHTASFDDYIPPIDKHNSLQYATAIGLALRGLEI